MAIELITWAAKTVTPLYDAIIQDTCAGRSGILHGCSLSASGNTITVGAGYGIIKGRLFKITSTTVNVTLATTGTLYGVLYIKLDLSNTSTPISIIANTSSTAYEVSQDADANFTDGVYEMELGTFNVSTTAISGLTASKNKVPYNRTPVYASLADLGLSSTQYVSTLFSRMADNSIATLPPSALRELPYSNAKGTVLLIRSDATHGNCYFLSEYGYPSYQCEYNTNSNGWKRMPYAGDLYYGMNETVTLRCSTGGFLTSGGTQIVFSVPTRKTLQSGRSLALSTGQIKVRQNGQYLIGSGSAYQEINTDLETSFSVYDNEIIVYCTDSRGFGGTNNAPVAVEGNVVFIEN